MQCFVRHKDQRAVCHCLAAGTCCQLGIARPAIFWHLRRYPLHNVQVLGDGKHFVFGLPTLAASFGERAKMLTVTCWVHKPMLAEWTSEILSLSLSLCTHSRNVQ